MTTSANQAFDARANVLRGQTIPNTMGGLGVPVVRARLGLQRTSLAACGAILAGLMLALAVGHGA